MCVDFSRARSILRTTRNSAQLCQRLVIGERAASRKAVNACVVERGAGGGGGGGGGGGEHVKSGYIDTVMLTSTDITVLAVPVSSGFSCSIISSVKNC